MPFVAQIADDPLGWVYLAIAVVFGLVLVALVVYAARSSRQREPGPPQEDPEDPLPGSAEPAPSPETSEDADEPAEDDPEPGEPPAPTEDDPEAPAPAAGGPRSLREALDAGADANAYLARFVHDPEGEELGETVGITDDDELVVKHDDGDLYALQADEVLERDDQLVVDPQADWDAARERGESWREGEEAVMEYDEDGLPILDD